MENISLWTTTETNNYLYKQMKALLESHGFVVSPIKAKKIARMREHHIQIVCPEVIYGVTRLQMFVVPAISYSNESYCDRRVELERIDDPKLRNNFYSDMAIRDEYTGKAWYPPEKIQQAWTEAMVPQIEKEVIAYFDRLGFTEFIHLSQNQRDGTLSYSGGPGNDNALHFLTMANNAIWMGDYDSSLPLLKKAVLGYEKSIENGITYREEIYLEDQLNQAVAREIIEVMENKHEGWENTILDRLRFLEKDAPEKAWGIALDEHGETMRVKKKK